jgi:hypothetical protein
MNTRVPGKIVPQGENLRRAMRWMSDNHQHDVSAIEEASRRFDLSPIEEEFLLREHARLTR